MPARHDRPPGGVVLTIVVLEPGAPGDPKRKPELVPEAVQRKILVLTNCCAERFDPAVLFELCRTTILI